jgi:integrase/recombinase XerD
MKVKAILREYEHYKGKDGSYPLSLLISKGKRRTYVSLCRLRPEQWECGQVVKHRNAGRLNVFISTKIAEALDAAIEAETKDFQATSNQIGRKIKGIKTDLFSYAEDFLTRFNNPKQRNTYKRYKAVITKLKEFTKRKISFNEVDVSFLQSLEKHLKKKGNGPNTINANMKVLKTIIYSAIKEDLLDQSNNPFFKYKLSTVKTKKDFLTIEELNKIRALDLPTGSPLWHARNIFLLQFNLMGMRFGDCISIKWISIISGRIKYRMNKTTDIQDILLSEEALQIISCYKKENDYLFGLEIRSMDDISSANAVVNKQLKAIGKLAVIEKKISTHMARHTYANHGLLKGIDLRLMQKALGHGSIRTTQIYAADLDNTLLDQANKIILG